MKVHRPTDNPITRGYSSTHRGYDFSGLNRPDEVRSGKDGTIVERVDEYATNWTNTGILTTKDYGNYIKVKHDDGTFALYAHLKKGSSFVKGTRVLSGQVIARIGNTGNSTGPHLHAEYRTAGNVNTSVEWYTEPKTDTIPVDKAVFENLVRKATAYDNVREKLNVEDSQTVVLAEITKFMSYKDSVIQKDNQITDIQKQATELQTQLTEKEATITEVSAQVATLTVAVGDAQKKIDSLTKQTKDDQVALEDLKLAAQITKNLTGFRKWIFDTFIR